MLQRFLLIGVFLVVVSAGAYFYLKPTSEALAKRALYCINQNDFNGAESILKSLPSQSTTYPLALYRGYLSQANGRLKEAESLFQTALREPFKGKRNEVLAEIVLAEGMNAFLEMRDADFCSLIQEARKIGPASSYLSFFEGLVHYLHSRYAEALVSWSSFAPNEDKDSSWLHSSFERFFPYAWRQLHLAHCLVEVGDLILGKEILERESLRETQESELHRLAALFLGLSYLKEGREMLESQRDSFYRLAHFYFDRAGTSLRFSRERGLLTHHLCFEIEHLLLEDLAKEQAKGGLFFIHTLQKWNAHEAIVSLAGQIAQTILHEPEAKREMICQALRKEFIGSPFLSVLTEKLFNTLALNLQAGETTEVLQAWPLVKALSSRPNLTERQLATLAAEEIFSIVNKDTEDLPFTKQFISFWQSLEHTPQEKEKLTLNLLLQSKLFWQKEGQEPKGRELMSICLQLNDQHPSALKEIETFLNDLYLRAEESNLIERLSYIYDAMCHFGIQKQDLISPSKLANHLADADYQYHTQNYTAATTHAGWVLKLDPENQQALKLVGLSSFHLGEYSKSFTTLSRLSNPDEQSYKILVISQAFSVQEPGHHLAQSDPSKSYD